MGMPIVANIKEGIPFFATHNLHTSTEGIYQKIIFSDKLEKKIIRKCLYKKKGDRAEYFDNAAKALGIIFMKFENQNEMNEILRKINEYYEVEVK